MSWRRDKRRAVVNIVRTTVNGKVNVPDDTINAAIDDELARMDITLEGFDDTMKSAMGTVEEAMERLGEQFPGMKPLGPRNPRIKDYDRPQKKSLKELLDEAGLKSRKLITVTPKSGPIAGRHKAAVRKANSIQDEYEVVLVERGIPLNIDEDTDVPVKMIPAARVYERLTFGERVRRFFRRLWPRKRLRERKLIVEAGSIADACDVCFGNHVVPLNGDLTLQGKCPVCCCDDCGTPLSTEDIRAGHKCCAPCDDADLNK